MIHFVTIYFKTFHSTMQFPGSLHRKALTDKIPPLLGEKMSTLFQVLSTEWLYNNTHQEYMVYL